MLRKLILTSFLCAGLLLPSHQANAKNQPRAKKSQKRALLQKRRTKSKKQVASKGKNFKGKTRLKKRKSSKRRLSSRLRRRRSSRVQRKLAQYRRRWFRYLRKKQRMARRRVKPFNWKGSYAKLRNKVPGLRRDVLRKALQAYACAWSRKKVFKKYLVVIDFTKASTQKRLWVLNLKQNRLVFWEWVSHGKHTGGLRARRFSNRVNSLQSSIGLYATAETYSGKHGYSLRLDGLEYGFNHRARTRAIVFHGASYVSTSYIKRFGKLGQSWGCPAVRNQISAPLIRNIREGGAIFIYYPNSRWLKNSSYLHCRR